jgi:hypothetical protein
MGFALPMNELFGVIIDVSHRELLHPSLQVQEFGEYKLTA